MKELIAFRKYLAEGKKAQPDDDLEDRLDVGDYGTNIKEDKDTEWPQEVLSLLGDITFKLEKVMSERAKYQVLDTKTGKIWDAGGYTFGKVSELESFASDYIKPLGGRQSLQFEESIESLKKKPLK